MDLVCRWRARGTHVSEALAAVGSWHCWFVAEASALDVMRVLLRGSVTLKLTAADAGVNEIDATASSAASHATAGVRARPIGARSSTAVRALLPCLAARPTAPAALCLLSAQSGAARSGVPPVRSACNGHETKALDPLREYHHNS